MTELLNRRQRLWYCEVTYRWTSKYKFFGFGHINLKFVQSCYSFSANTYVYSSQVQTAHSTDRQTLIHNSNRQIDRNYSKSNLSSRLLNSKQHTAKASANVGEFGEEAAIHLRKLRRACSRHFLQVFTVAVSNGVTNIQLLQLHY